MGVSTDAIICFGIECGDPDEQEEPAFLDGFEDFDDYLDSLSDLPQWGEEGHSFEEQRAAREKCPADMVMHCSYEYPMYILTVRGTETKASRGYPAELDAAFPEVSEDKIQAFKEWAAERGIEGEPKWLLCSMWG